MDRSKKTIIIASAAILLLYLVVRSNKAFASPTARNIMRGVDNWGSGAFGASRGSRKHEGIDYVAAPGETIYSPITGVIERPAYPYEDDLTYTGAVISNAKHEVKIFYIALTVPVGTFVKAGDIIAKAQNIAEKYGSDMMNHIHLEIREKKSGKILNPKKILP